MGITLLHYERDDISNHQLSDFLLNRFFFRSHIKENTKAPRRWLLWREFASDRWFPHTNGQSRKMFPFDDVIMRLSRFNGTTLYLIRSALQVVFRVTIDHLVTCVLRKEFKQLWIKDDILNSWRNNYMYRKLWEAIAYSCHNYKSDLVKPSLIPNWNIDQ